MPPEPTSAGCIVSLIVPTLNEAQNIEALIDRSYRALSKMAPRFELIVVDDNSEDGTHAIASGLIPRYPGLSVIRRQKPRDLAGSVVDGWDAAKGELLAVIDGDLQHPPEKLADLLGVALETNADIVVASRHVPGGGVSEWSLARRIVSWVACLIAGFLLPGTLKTVRDPMSGFFVLRRRLLDSLTLKPKGYKILLEILARANYSTVIEVPYTFEERKEGASKLGPSQAFDYLGHVAALSWDTGELFRVAKYFAVGILGLMVNVGVASWLLKSGGAPLLACLAIGFETAVLNNFFFNEHWTFRDVARRRGSIESTWVRMSVFHIISLVGLSANLLIFSLMRLAATPELPAMAGGAVAAGLCNFFLNTHITWSLWQGEEVSVGGSKAHARRKVSDVLKRVYATRYSSASLANSRPK